MKVIKSKTFDKWLTGLHDFTAVNKIIKRIEKIEEEGYLGAHHSVGGYVSELVIDYGPGYRVYYTEKGDTLVVFLGGSTKKRQSELIERMQKIAQEWR